MEDKDNDWSGYSDLEVLAIANAQDIWIPFSAGGGLSAADAAWNTERDSAAVEAMARAEKTEKTLRSRAARAKVRTQ